VVKDRETAAWEDGQSHKEPLQLDSEAEVEAAGAPESAESLVAGRGTSVISSNFRNLFPKNLMNAFDNCSFDHTQKAALGQYSELIGKSSHILGLPHFAIQTGSDQGFKGIEDLSNFFINGKKIEDQDMKYVTPQRPEPEANKHQDETPAKEHKQIPRLFNNFEHLKKTHCYCIPDFQKLRLNQIDSSQNLLKDFFRNLDFASLELKGNLSLVKEK